MSDHRAMGSYSTHRSAHMIRAVHLCPKRLTSKEGVQDGLPRKKTKSYEWTAHFCYMDDTHIRVDTTNGYAEHDVGCRVRETDKSDQNTHGEYDGKETRLDGTANKSVQNCIRLAETSSRTGEDDHQRNWGL